jgi:hypothetical protein
MSDPYFPEQPGEEEASNRSSWRDRVKHAPRAAVIAGLVAVLAVGGTGVAFAAGSGSSSTTAPPSTSPTTTPAKAKGPHGPFGRAGFGPLRGLGGLGLGGMAGGGVVHGTVTVRTSSGYKTLDIQLGTVNNVSPTSITVASPDGYTKTYAVTSATLVNSQAAGINSVKAKDQVSVVATVSGTSATDPATATSIVDLTKIKGSWKAFGFGPPPANGSSGSKTPAGADGNPGPGVAGGPSFPA